MKSSGVNTSNMRFRALPLLLLCVFFIPLQARASTPQCDPATTTARGGYFTDYQSDEYSPQGFLIQHFKNDPTYPYAWPTTLYWRFLDDECNHASPFLFSTSFGLPIGVTDWSIRFASPTHFDVWDDDHGVIVASSTVDRVSSLRKRLVHRNARTGISYPYAP